MTARPDFLYSMSCYSTSTRACVIINEQAMVH